MGWNFRCESQISPHISWVESGITTTISSPRTPPFNTILPPVLVANMDAISVLHTQYEVPVNRDAMPCVMQNRGTSVDDNSVKRSSLSEIE